MYKGSNAEKLNNMSLYDLLCRMQKNAEKHHKSGAYACVIAYLEGESPIWRCAEFMENKRASCNKCIAAWLNEPHEGGTNGKF